MYVGSMTKSELSSFIKDCIKQAINENSSLIVDTKSSDTDFCSIQEFAVKFRITKATVHNWIKRGNVTRKKINGRSLVRLLEYSSLD